MTASDHPAFFFRLLHTPIDAKGESLADQVAALNQEGRAADTFALEPAEFVLIPTSPFAYWTSSAAFRIMRDVPPAEGNVATFRRGLGTNDDFRFLRLWWEALSDKVGTVWWLHAKGGAFSPYYYDVHLLVDWENDGEHLRQYCRERGDSPSRNIRSETLYFRPGLTWPLRTTSGISVRALPAGCIFGSKGPAAFVQNDGKEALLSLLAVMSSALFESLIRLQLGAATAAARSYEVGIIQRTPIPPITLASCALLSSLAREAHDLQRDHDRTAETTHAFCLPGLVQHRAGSLHAAGAALDVAAHSAAERLTAIQSQIDDLVFDLYGLSEADRALVRREMAGPSGTGPEVTGDASSTDHESLVTSNEEAEDEAPSSPQDLSARVQDLLQWCVGVAFGRWDVRKALDPGLLPPLGGPFDPLPRCAPGSLVDAAGLPLDAAPEKYPLDVAWNGILVDDPAHPADLVGRVRQVLALLWGHQADEIEREACEILGIRDLRNYFRDPRTGFFAWHIKRYSKSRRKAPLYWLLQSEKRGYAVWLYAHRMGPTTLLDAGRGYVDGKVKLEEARLRELRRDVDRLSGAARRERERDIERQQRLVAEVAAFRQRLDKIALLDLPPDLNDGVLISIAPLWELVPWKEAQRMWAELVAGKYEWSTMSKQMRDKGLVRSP